MRSSMNITLATEWVPMVAQHWNAELRLRAIDTVLWNLRQAFGGEGIVLSTYEIKRDDSDHRKVKPWIVLKDGVPMKYDPHNHYRQTFSSKRLAKIAADKDAEWDVYLAIVLADDASGEYHWTAEEEQQIANLTLSLQLNEEKWTFNGKQRFVDISREHQAKDAEDQAKTNWTSPHYPEQLRRRMAARAEAFKRAGLEL